MRAIGFLVLICLSGEAYADSYSEAAKHCQDGKSEYCTLLRKFCVEDSDPKACFHLAYVLGLKGDDDTGLIYLRKACSGGLPVACSFIPEVIEYIRTKTNGEKTSI